MTAGPISAAAAQRTLLLLSATRWFPVGLIIGLVTLLMLERGLTLTQVGIAIAAQGIVLLALELPTGGLADALGRRPVLIVAGITAIVAAVIFVLAPSFVIFVLAWGLQGIFRALDSGPLEAWYVDTAHAEDPQAPVERALARAGTVLGLAIAVGALGSGGLVVWAPVPGWSPLLLPFVLAIGINVVHLVLTIVLVRETRPVVAGSRWRRVLGSVRQVPGTVAAGVGMLRTAPVLRSVVLVEVFWSVAMIAFETFNQVRLAELVGGEERAGAIIGPVSAVSWGLFAVGSALAGLASRWIGVAWTALLARVLNGAFVVGMGLAAGPVGLIAAFLAAYTLHGTAGPMHNTLLHRQAGPANRATVLSINSMVAGGAASLGLLVLGPLAEHTSTATAILVAGAFSILGAVLYLPARRQERNLAGTAELQAVDA
ncbi:MAG TPA: MFS transporter [Propionibacteriaceae bacterium]|jgi:MFS family permease|nr:MFS transporter [Propionibacteriaceae bacterium]